MYRSSDGHVVIGSVVFLEQLRADRHEQGVQAWHPPFTYPEESAGIDLTCARATRYVGRNSSNFAVLSSNVWYVCNSDVGVTRLCDTSCERRAEP